MVPYMLLYNNNKKTGYTSRFQDWVCGLSQKRHFDVLRDKLSMDVAPKLQMFCRVLLKYNHHRTVTILFLGYLCACLGLVLFMSYLYNLFSFSASTS